MGVCSAGLIATNKRYSFFTASWSNATENTASDGLWRFTAATSQRENIGLELYNGRSEDIISLVHCSSWKHFWINKAFR